MSTCLTSVYFLNRSEGGYHCISLQVEDYWKLERKLVGVFCRFWEEKKKKKQSFIETDAFIFCIIYSLCRDFLHYFYAFSSLLPISKTSLKNRLSKRTMYQLFLTSLEPSFSVLMRMILGCSLTACTKTWSQN